MQHGDMDMKLWHAVWTSNMEMQHRMQRGYTAWRHGHKTKTYSLNMQRVKAAWTNSISMQHGELDMNIFIINKQHGHPAKIYCTGWTCSLDM
jgi:hypothetical protein